MFVKGQSGNPGGRLKSPLNKILSQYMFKRPKGRRETYGELIVQKILSLVLMDGNLDALEYAWDRLEGKIPNVEIVGQGQTVMDFRRYELADGKEKLKTEIRTELSYFKTFIDRDGIAS